MIEPIYIDETDASQLNVSKKEAIRYLGYILARPDEVIDEQIDEMICEIKSLMKCRSTYTKRSITMEGNQIDLGFSKIESFHLARHLKGCKEVYLFVATLGADVDRRIRRYQMVSPAKGAIAQAVAASAIEAYCDHINDFLEKEARQQGCALKRRFSPGYGDLPLAFQKPFLHELDASRRLGLCLTDGFLMVPEKSVSAIIGVYES